VSDARYVKRLVTIRFSFLRPGEIPTLIVEDRQPGSEIVPSCRLDRGSLAFKTFCRPWNRDVWWGNRGPLYRLASDERRGNYPGAVAGAEPEALKARCEILELAG
jgi:hypothetical protein